MNQPNETLEHRILQVVHDTMDAWSNALGGRFPEATTGDFPPDADGVLTEAIRAATKYWARLNLPKDYVEGPYGHGYWLVDGELWGAPMYVDNTITKEEGYPVDEFDEPLSEQQRAEVLAKLSALK